MKKDRSLYRGFNCIVKSVMDVALWLWFVYKILKGVCYIGLAFFLGFVLLLALQIICYVAGLYGEMNGRKLEKCVENYFKIHPPDNINYMPTHIHQIYFSINNNSSPLPKKWEITQDTWKDKNPDFDHTLWDSSRFLELLRKYYPELEPIYNSYSHWVMQTDLARFVILHHFGGIYVDTDVRCRKSLKPLYYFVTGRFETVLYGTKPFGVATDFIMSRAGSPFLKHVLCGLKTAQRQYILPYFTALLSTGPLYLSLQYLTYGRQSDVRILEEPEMLRFIRNLHSGTWHGWDGDAIWWLFVHRNMFLTLLCLVFVTVVMCMFHRKIKYCKNKLARVFRRKRYTDKV